MVDTSCLVNKSIEADEVVCIEIKAQVIKRNNPLG
jgi:hypothetical protein